MGEKEDIFDDGLRSLMEDAEERVPKRVWSELSERLAAEGLQEAKPVVIPLWARWSSVGVAVAAALVLGVFLFMRGGEETIGDVLVAEVTETESTSENAVIAEAAESFETNVESSENATFTAQPKNVGNATRPVTSDSIIARRTETTDNIDSVDDYAETSIAGGILASNESSESEDGAIDSNEALTSNEGSAEVPESSLAEQIAESPKYIAEANVASEPWSDPFAETVSTGAPKKPRTAVTVSGNAFGNASNGSSSSSTGIRRQMASSIDGQPTEGISEKSDSNYGIPATFGVGVKILFTPRWSLGVGVNYSLLSRTFSGEYTSYDAAGSFTTESYSNIRHRVDYIGIPVNAYFSIIQSHAVDFYAYAGGTVEKAVSSRYILDHGIPSYKESVKGVQCSADIGIGVEFIVVDWLGIYIDPNLRYYFPNSHQPKSIRTQEPLNFGFEIGLRFRL